MNDEDKKEEEKRSVVRKNSPRRRWLGLRRTGLPRKDALGEEETLQYLKDAQDFADQCSPSGGAESRNSSAEVP